MRAGRWLFAGLMPLWLWAQAPNPVVTSLALYNPATPGQPGTTAITTVNVAGGGANADFTMVVNGSGFTTGSLPYVLLSTAAGFSFPQDVLPANINGSGTQLLVTIPGYVLDAVVTDPSTPAPPFLVDVQMGFNSPAALSVTKAQFTVNAPVAAATSPLPAAVVNSAYDRPLVTGGTAPFTLLSGTPPAGLTVSTSGHLTGTPGTAGTYNFTLAIRDAWQQTVTASYSLTVTNALSITTTSPLPSGTAGSAYSTAITAAGGTPPYSWALAGTNPAGFTLTANVPPTTAQLAGTPGAAGNYVFNVRVTDSAAASATVALTVPVQNPLTITTTSPLANCTAGATCTRQVTATGGLAPLTWAGSKLPAWLSLNTGNGTLTGTPPAATTVNFDITVTDSLAPVPRTALQSYTLTVAGPFSITTTSPLPRGTVGTAYSQALAATGGNTPVTWNVTGGALPSPLTLSAGTISGTPAAAGNYSVTITASEPGGASASRTFALPVDDALSITTTSPLPNGTLNAAYSTTLAAAGGLAPRTWAASGLPAGWALSTAGALTGTPASLAPVVFTATVSDAYGRTTNRQFTIYVASGVTLTTSSLPHGTVGTAYLQTLGATGGNQPYTWSVIAGALPGTVALNPTSGVLSGTPDTAGTFNFTAQVTEAAGSSDSRALALIVDNPLSITTTSPLPDATAGAAYSTTVSATGGAQAYTWSASGLPAGWTLNAASGVLTATPGAPGTVTFTATVTDAVSRTVSRQFTVTVAAAIQITTVSLARGTAGTAYSQTLAATGGRQPYTWSVSAGTLPSGLALDSSTGTLAGIPGAGAFSFTIQARDTAGATATRAYTVTIDAPLTITTAAALPHGSVGVAYSTTLAAAGGAQPYSWSASGLPPNWTISAGSGLVSGTPAAAGTITFTATVTDALQRIASQQFSIAVVTGVAITTAALPHGLVGQAYTQTLAATGGFTPYTWSIPAGALPAGFTLDPASGTISGLPQAAGTSNFTVQVTAARASSSDTRSFTLIIDGPLAITTTSPLPNATQNAAYSTTLAAAGGAQPYSWSATGLPAGWTLNPSTGVLSATPTAAGTVSFTATVADSSDQVDRRTFTITVAPRVTITTLSLPHGTVGTVYQQTVTATGGNAPLTWSLAAGTLPGGLALNASSGLLSGTPTAAGTFNITILAVDAVGGADSRAFALAIDVPLAITTVSPLPAGTAGTAYTTQLAATGGAQPYQWAITGLPAGWTFNAATGAISGTPSSPGTLNFNATVSDAVQRTASRSFALTIGAPELTISTTALPGATRDQAYSAALTASGGTQPYTWTLSAGSLPPGLQLAGGGTISGTPTAAGNFGFTAQVADSGGRTATRQFGIHVAAPLSTLTIATTALPGGTVGLSYSARVSATGGEPPYTWTFSMQAPGLTGNRDGTITGTPSQAGTFQVTATVTDSSGRTASTTLPLAITGAGLTITTVSPLPEGAAHVAYSVTFAASGGKPPYVWAAMGLPAGLAMSPGGVLSGTAAQGTYSFKVQVTDADRTVAAKDFTLSIVGLRITTASLPAGTVDRPYRATLAAEGGAPPYHWSASGLPGGLAIDAATGAITGTPAAVASARVTARVTDSKGAEAAKAFDLTIAGAGLTIITASPLANATVGVAYSGRVEATGGRPPYRWAVVAGWGGGITVGADGALGGTPGDAGDYTMYIQVTDAEGKTAVKPFAVTVEPPVLTISTASLPAGTVGAPYTATLSATGNVGPVSWSADGLPEGLALDSGGTLSGTPAAPGTSSVTVRAADQAGRTVTRLYTVTVGLPPTPAVTFTGVSDLVNPAQQPVLGIGLTGTYPVPISGRVALAFAPEAGGDDPAVQFSTGGRTANFTIPAGANLATFTVPNLGLQTGTVAGIITLTASLSAAGTDITPSPAPSRTLRITASAPVITAARLNRTATGFEIQITGYSTTRDVTQAVFRFTASQGGTLQTTEVTVPVGPAFTTWFSSAASAPFGSRFTFTQPFTVAGDISDIASISVSLVNRAGTSAAVTVSM